MYNRSDVIYGYDGTWEGLLSCVFASFEKREMPLDIRCFYWKDPIFTTTQKQAKCR